eukprot:TRINITY_DN12860_c0_g2_i4.p1 TRINITY_DN12860_c0_g2~~TRINITY_DN12860_c0_g2_i4.p1  ORF type:complete len:411 (+),score=113.84 TRINITY_DN12860_c0_g2_i4:484-1716(+)
MVVKGARAAPSGVNEHKERGNLYMKTGDHEKAVECYTAAIEKLQEGGEHVDDLVILYTNRAQAYFKMRDYKLSHLDCCSALKLRDTHVKAIFRRGHCHMKLERYAEAKADFERAKSLLPDDPEIQTNLDFVKSKIRQLKEEILRKMEITARSANQDFRRVKVVELSPAAGDAVEKQEVRAEKSEMKQNVADTKQANAEQNEEEDHSHKKVRFSAHTEDVVIQPELRKRVAHDPSKAPRRGSLKRSSLKPSEVAQGNSKPNKPESKPVDIEKSFASQIAKEIEGIKPEDMTAKVNHFKRFWKNLKSNISEAAKLFKEFDPNALLKGYPQGVEVEELLFLIDVLYELAQTEPKLAKTFLETITKFKRLGIVWQLMMDKERLSLRKLLDKLVADLSAEAVSYTHLTLPTIYSV